MASKDTVLSSLKSAVSAGIISTNSISAINTGLDDMALSGCSGVDADAIDSEDVTLVAVLIDASQSMDSFSNEVIRSYNEDFLGSLSKAKNAESILVSTWTFSSNGTQNVRLVNGYTPVKKCPKLTQKEYSPSGMTPLYDAVMKGITGIVSYGQTLRDNGTRTKSIVVVISDGAENSSSTSKSATRGLAEDVLKSQEFILSYIFFGNEKDGDNAAKDINFPLNHRLTSNLDGAGIRRVFGTTSASVISASQSSITTSSQNPFFVNGR